MNIRHCIIGVFIGIFLGVAMLLTVTVSITKRADIEATEDAPPAIVLMIVGTRPDGLDLVWSDENDNPISYDLFDDRTGMAIASFEPGQTRAVISGLTCGIAYRFWLVSEDGRSSNSIVGITGPCREEPGQ